MHGKQLSEGALAGVAVLEGALTRLEDFLLRAQGAGRARLYYHKTNDQFEWRRRIARGQHEYLGKALTNEWLSRLRSPTRARALALDRLVQARVAGRGVLRLAQAITEQCDEWGDPVLTVRWTDGKMRRLTCWCLLNGGGVRRSTLNQPPPPRFADEIARLQPSATLLGAGAVGQWVQAMVEELQEIDGQLARWQQRLKSSSVRLYHNAQSDTWMLRGFRQTGEWVHLHRDHESNWEGLMQPVPAVVREVRAALEQRRRMRRGLWMIHLLTQLARSWPGGTWYIRSEAGQDSKRRRAKTNWVLIAGPRGLLFRDYRSAAPTTDDEQYDGRRDGNGVSLPEVVS